MCDSSIVGGDVAIGGGAYWSGNANSNSNELENRIHSITYVDSTGNEATNGEIPRGIRVRGEVDKDGDDTLTAQVPCFPAFWSCDIESAPRAPEVPRDPRGEARLPSRPA